MHYRKLIALVARSAAAVVGARRCARADRNRPSRHPERRQDQRVRQAGWPTPASCWCACRSPRWSRSNFPTRGPGYLDLARADEALHGATEALPDRQHRGLRKRRAAAAAAGRRFSGVAAVRQIRSASTMAPSRTCGTSAAQHHGSLLEPAAARRAARIFPIRSDRLGIRDRSPRRPVRADGHDTAFASCRPTVPSGRSSSTAIPGSFGSIRAGIRPHCASWGWASGTSSRASTICCSCAVS